MSRPEPPVFEAPWQAAAFALTVALVEGGHLSWQAWTQRFASRRADAPQADGSDYFAHWLDALEAHLAEAKIASAGDLADLSAAWHRAAAMTPHGVPVRLENARAGSSREA